MGILQQCVKQVLEDDDVITQNKVQKLALSHICSHASMYEHARYEHVSYICVM